MATPPLPPYTIAPVTTPEDIKATTNLFKAYAETLGIDLSFQNFASELASLPGPYSPPTGTLLLARSREDQIHTSTTSSIATAGAPPTAIGCAALRPLPSYPGISELKRLYVSPLARGTGVGRALVTRLLSEAKAMGYERCRLDTLPSMASARSLYRSLGFEEIEAYYSTPLEGTAFMEVRLC
ncbi:hypothetical protein B0A50_04125 [Salinomyces thailandicus]|uniref:N-acetyltransferase domain-containing protein n=1 Tax=Salinomyces thailandicus TaxID=706561 RepID=A0A4U0U0F0_9PEZI|nr:hypothetical protein B0A50_04125 [Salinomyces thailandica]